MCRLRCELITCRLRIPFPDPLTCVTHIVAEGDQVSLAIDEEVVVVYVCLRRGHPLRVELLRRGTLTRKLRHLIWPSIVVSLTFPSFIRSAQTFLTKQL